MLLNGGGAMLQIVFVFVVANVRHVMENHLVNLVTISNMLVT